MKQIKRKQQNILDYLKPKVPRPAESQPVVNKLGSSVWESYSKFQNDDGTPHRYDKLSGRFTCVNILCFFYNTRFVFDNISLTSLG